MVLLSALIILTYGTQSLLENSVAPTAIIFCCLLFSTLKKARSSLPLASCTLLILLLTQIPDLKNLWPLPSILVTFTIAALLWKSDNVDGYGLLEFRAKPALASAFIGLLCFSGVTAWVYFTQPSLSQIPFKAPEDVSTPLVILSILLFAFFNSFAEEFIFRGLALKSMSGRSSVFANIVQSVGFMFLHYKGFPFGISGAVLGGIFAFIMGLLRIKTNSLSYSWFAHFVTNVGMGLLLYSMT